MLNETQIPGTSLPGKDNSMLPHRCLYDSSWGEEKECSKYAGDDFRKHLDSHQ